MSRIQTFIKDESGAITIDWVVITAGVVGLVIAVFTWLGGATHDQGEEVGSFMSTQGVKTTY